MGAAHPTHAERESLMTVKELADKLAKIISEGHGDRETCVYDDGLQVMGVELSDLHFDGLHFQRRGTND